MTVRHGLLAAFVVASLCLYALQFSKRERLRHRQWLLSIFVGGSVLRFIYCCLTPFSERCWDWAGHIESIDYVLHHWRIPPAQGGWQFTSRRSIILRPRRLLNWRH
jgi:hypothetical protein